MSLSPLCYPSDLSDAEWDLLAPLIPPAKPGDRPRKWPMRTILDGIFYLLRSPRRSAGASGICASAMTASVQQGPSSP